MQQDISRHATTCAGARWCRGGRVEAQRYTSNGNWRPSIGVFLYPSFNMYLSLSLALLCSLLMKQFRRPLSPVGSKAKVGVNSDEKRFVFLAPSGATLWSCQRRWGHSTLVPSKTGNQQTIFSSRHLESTIPETAARAFHGPHTSRSPLALLSRRQSAAPFSGRA